MVLLNKSRCNQLYNQAYQLLKKKIENNQKLLLMLDYDGTLVPIKENPQLAVPDPSLINLLKQLSQSKLITLAIISGRNVEDLKGFLPLNNIYLTGCHGAVIEYPDGKTDSLISLDNLQAIMQQIRDLAYKCTMKYTGFLVELKKTSCALHYRQANPVHASLVLKDYVSKCNPFIRKYNLELLKGKKVVEVRPRSVNKGKAVKYLQKLNPDAFPVYFGDDTTDEDAFQVLQEKGMSILVSEYDRPTSAHYLIANPQEVFFFLEKLFKESWK